MSYSSGKSTYPSLPVMELLRQPGVAIIDDDAELTRAIARILRTKYNCFVKGYDSVEAFLEDLDRPDAGRFFDDSLDLILLDFHLPGRNGPRLVKELLERRSPLLDRSHIMGITGDGQARVVSQFKDAGIEDILKKPLEKLDFGRIAEKAYRICAGQESPRRPMPKIITKYI